MAYFQRVCAAVTENILHLYYLTKYLEIFRISPTLSIMRTSGRFVMTEQLSSFSSLTIVSVNLAVSKLAVIPLYEQYKIIVRSIFARDKQLAPFKRTYSFCNFKEKLGKKIIEELPLKNAYDLED